MDFTKIINDMTIYSFYGNTKVSLEKLEIKEGITSIHIRFSELNTNIDILFKKDVKLNDTLHTYLYYILEHKIKVNDNDYLYLKYDKSVTNIYCNTEYNSKKNTVICHIYNSNEKQHIFSFKMKLI